MNLHDWIDELCDVLDIETEVDEALILDLARVAAHNVERPAAPITTYLLGFAAAAHDGEPRRGGEAGRARPSAGRGLGPAAGRTRTPTTSTTRSDDSVGRPHRRGRAVSLG